MFRVDANERPYMIRALEAAGLEVKIQQLNRRGLGDFFWEGRQQNYSVEHKSIRGIVPNFFGRPAYQMTKQMREAKRRGDTVVILAIEGVCSEDIDTKHCNMYMLNNAERRYEKPTESGTTYNAWSAWKARLITNGILILEYPDSRSLATGMFELYNTTVDKDIELPFNYTKKIAHDEPVAMQMLMVIPGIGKSRARRLLLTYNSLAGVLESGGREWPFNKPNWSEFQSYLQEFYAG